MSIWSDIGEWTGTNNMSGKDWLAFAANPGLYVTGAMAKKGLNTAGDAAAGDQPQMEGIDPELEEFYQMLKQPVNPNSPYAKFALGNATTAANRDAASRGIQGGLSGANTQQAYMNAYAGLDMQRQQQLQQALGMRMRNQDMNQMRYDQQMAQWQQARQGPIKMLGGLAGAGIGAFVGGPQGAMAGYQMGGGLASEFAGMGQPNYYGAKPPSYGGGGY